MAASALMSAPQSTDEMEAESITPECPICTGDLDKTVDIFRRHEHPFILVSTLAMTWSGVNSLAQAEIDILVHSSTVQIIVKDLIDIGEWELCNNPASEETHMDASLIKYHFNP
jgi:hypothetical protein